MDLLQIQTMTMTMTKIRRREAKVMFLFGLASPSANLAQLEVLRDTVVYAIRSMINRYIFTCSSRRTAKTIFIQSFALMATYKLVLVRHGESEWNQKNLFCGWYDADLSEKGLEEAKQAGKWLKEGGYTFDIAFTSVLKRAIKTLYNIQQELDLHWIPVYRHWRLNERMYGALQGKNKSETAAKYGEDQVKVNPIGVARRVVISFLADLASSLRYSTTRVGRIE